jgi:UDP-glucose 4-epimerase
MSWTGRRVAVIGGTGFIGSHLTERLVTAGADVLAVARTTARISHLAAVRSDCTIALADVCDGETMIRMLRRFRPEVVFHLASHPDGPESFAHVAESIRTNGTGLMNTLQAATAAGAELFVYGDSAKDFGNGPVPYRETQAATPVCSYAIMKAAGWQLCQLVSSFTPIKTVALRPTFVYGPRQNRNVISYVYECVRAGRPVRLMGGNQTRDPFYIDDAVSAFMAAATSKEAWGHAIPIGGGQEVTVTALCEEVIGALGGSVQVIAGAEQSRLTEIWRSTSDNTEAYQLLGWRPRVGLAEGIRRMVADWRAGEREVPPAGIGPARPDTYLHAAAPGVVYRMLDRREGPDRRSTARGGRRMEDIRALTEFRTRAEAESSEVEQSPFHV